MNFLSSTAKVVIGIVVTPVLCVAAQAQAPKGRLKTRIDTVVKAEIKRQEIPGLSVAVLSKERIVFSKAYGMADLENQVPVTRHSLFRTASVAKPITATAATILWQQGKLDLDAPIQLYCPAFPEKPWPITARQLLGHLSGIRHYKSNSPDDPEISSTYHYAKLSDAFSLFANDPLVSQPGTAYLYSTFGYTVVGCVLEGAAAESFPNLLLDLVFRPARMDHSTVDDALMIIPDRVRGYARAKDGSLQNGASIDSSDKYPGGGLLVTAEDLCKFALALESGRLLQPVALKMMWAAQTTSTGSSTGYGLGWGILSDHGELALAHTGSQQGASATLLLIPSRRFAVAIMANIEDVDSATIAHAVADAVRIN